MRRCRTSIGASSESDSPRRTVVDRRVRGNRDAFAHDQRKRAASSQTERTRPWCKAFRRHLRAAPHRRGDVRKRCGRAASQSMMKHLRIETRGQHGSHSNLRAGTPHCSFGSHGVFAVAPVFRRWRSAKDSIPAEKSPDSLNFVANDAADRKHGSTTSPQRTGTYGAMWLHAGDSPRNPRVQSVRVVPETVVVPKGES